MKLRLWLPDGFTIHKDETCWYFEAANFGNGVWDCEGEAISAPINISKITTLVWLPMEVDE